MSNNKGTEANDMAIERLSNDRETALSEFISKLGDRSCKKTANHKNVHGNNVMTKQLSDFEKYLDPDSQMGIGAVCSFPSLDLGDKELPMPTVGASSSSGLSKQNSSTDVPSMRASILDLTDLTKTSQPSKDPHNTSCSVEKANKNVAVLEQAAVRNLASPTTWTPSTVASAPQSMLQNLSQSYLSLVESRVKAWTLLLLRKSLSSGAFHSIDIHLC